LLYRIILYRKSFIEVNQNKDLFGGKTCSKNAIMKLYSLLREKKKTMHRKWNNNKMGSNISPDGYPIFEIDESEIIGNNQVIYWMFGIIDRVSKDCRVFCVLNDRTANNLMKIVKDNFATNENPDMDLDEEYLENTHIFSDCFFFISRPHLGIMDIY